MLDRRFVVALFACLVSVAQLARAQSGAPIEYAAPDACPPQSRFSAEVDARLAGAGAGVGARRHAALSVEIVPAGDGWLGTLSVGSPSLRAFRDHDCDALVRTLATAAAVALDGGAEQLAPPAAVPPPPPSPAPETPDDEGVRVVIRSARPGLTLHRSSRSQSTNGMIGSAEFDRLCTAPCEVRLPAGSHVFGVSEGTSGPVPAEELVPIASDAALSLEYEDRTPFRVLGWSLLVASAGGALGSTFYIIDRSEAGDGAGLALGVGLMVASLVAYVVGWGFSMDFDDSTVRVDGPL